MSFLRYCAHYLICHRNRNSKAFLLLKIIFEKVNVDVNSKNLEWTPLLFVATKMGDIATMRFLISRGAHINILVPNRHAAWCDINHLAALHFTAERANAKAMACLLEAGADVNLKDGNGRTAIRILCTLIDGNVKKAFIDCCELLIQYGARVDTLHADDLYGI